MTQRRIAELESALREVRDAIMRADPDVLTDTLWMPEDALKGATIVDRIDIALEPEKVDALVEENVRLRTHLEWLRGVAIVILSDWWPLVYDRTSRETVKKQGTLLRNAINNSTVNEYWPDGERLIAVDQSLLKAAIAEIRMWKVNKGGDDQVVLNLETILRNQTEI